LCCKVLDVGRDGVEEARGGGLGVEAEGDAQLSVEVSAAERRVVAVGELAVGVLDATPQGSEETRLSDAGLAAEEGRGAGSHGGLEVVDERRLRGRELELSVADLLREGLLLELEVADVRHGMGAYLRPPPGDDALRDARGCVFEDGSRDLRGLRPMALSRRVVAGSKSTCFGRSGRSSRGRVALACGLTGLSSKRFPSCSTHASRGRSCRGRRGGAR